MTTLSHKLWRTIKSTRGQFIALVIIVTLGVMVYNGMGTAFDNLSRAQQTFYQEENFADYYFQVVKAPAFISNKIEAIAGVRKASGRIQCDVPLVKEDNKRAVGRITSYALPMDGEVNRLRLLSGRLFTTRTSGSGIEVLIDPQYAAANSINVGDIITIIAAGKKVNLRVVGTATSPEFIINALDASNIMPDPETFGIIMMATEQAERILDMSGQVNQIAVKLDPGTNEEIVRQKAEALLQSYGNIVSYPRKDQLSHFMLQAELEGLKINSLYIPLLLLLIAAGIQSLILNRLIKSQRLQIGVMKALGYDDRKIIGHYTGYALCVSLLGCLLGIALGILLASLLSQVYSQFFNLPRTIGGLSLKTVFYSVILCLTTGTVSGFLATRSVIRIHPAEAMRPEAPAAGNQIFLEKWSPLWRKLSSNWKMSLRSVFRNRSRFVVMVLGVMSAVILLIFAFFNNDAVDYILNRNFQEINRYDYIVHFTEPIKYSEITYWRQWEEVYQLEPLLELPVKTVYSDKSVDDLIIGMATDGSLKRVLNETGEHLLIPEEGVLIGRRTAQKLGVKISDKVNIETKLGIGPLNKAELSVLGINDQLTGSGSYVSLATANRILGESQVISSVMFRANQGNMADLEKRLKAMPNVSSITSREQELQSYYTMMDTTIYFIGVTIFLSALLGLVIVYNSSIMTFYERKRELASLIVMGYSQLEVVSLLRKETWIQAAVGTILGLPAGKWLGTAYVASVSTDLYSLPVIIYPRSYLLAVIAAILFVSMGQFLAARKIEQLNMVEVLKNRE
jgi:putative ABC transport system permease protein